jgi:hypothetical protein
MRGTFSHMMYDDMTETVFLYFNNATVLNLAPMPATKSETDYEECCLYLKPDQYKKLKDYLNAKPNLVDIE